MTGIASTVASVGNVKILGAAAVAAWLTLSHAAHNARRRRVRAALHGKLLGQTPEGKGGVRALYDARTHLCPGLSETGIVHLITRAFIGTSTAEPEWGIHWLLGPKLSDRLDPTGERFEIVTLFMTCALKTNAIYPAEGAVLGSEDNEGELAAVNVVRVFRGNYLKSLWEPFWETRIAFEAMLTGTMPKVYMDSNQGCLRGHIDARVKQMVDVTMQKLHCLHAPGPHIYVAVMATSPEKQGKGHCSRLMRAISRAADLDKLPCYLECTSERNCKIYQRFGYRVVGQYTVSVEKDETGSLPFEHLYCMLRPPE